MLKLSSKIKAFLKQNKGVEIVALIVILLIAALLLYNSLSSKSVSSDKSESEAKLEQVLSKVVSQDVSVVINESDGSVTSVVILLADDSLSNRLKILSVTSSTLNIDRSLVHIYQANK